MERGTGWGVREGERERVRGRGEQKSPLADSSLQYLSSCVYVFEISSIIEISPSAELYSNCSEQLDIAMFWRVMD